MRTLLVLAPDYRSFLKYKRDTEDARALFNTGLTVIREETKYVYIGSERAARGYHVSKEDVVILDGFWHRSDAEEIWASVEQGIR